MTAKAPIGLPSFFQNAPTTIMEELAEFELGGDLEDTDLGEALEDEEVEEVDIDDASEQDAVDELREDNEMFDEMRAIDGFGADEGLDEVEGGKAGAPTRISLAQLMSSSVSASISQSKGPVTVAEIKQQSSTAGSDPLTRAMQALSTDVAEAKVPDQQPAPPAAAFGLPQHLPPPQFFPPQFYAGHPPQFFPGHPPQFFPPNFGNAPPMFFNGPPPPFPPPFPHAPNFMPPHAPMPPHFPPQFPPQPHPQAPPQHLQRNQSSESQPRPQQQQQQQQRRPKPLPHGSMMSPSDVKFVVGKSLQSLGTVDQFNEDFYYIQLQLKKQAKELERAAAANEAPSHHAFEAPLPMWADTKLRILSQLEESKKSLMEKTKTWESKEMVLGHTQRSDATKPRAILTVPSVWEDADKDGPDGGPDEDSPSHFTQLFSSRLWSMRQAVQRGYHALSTVQELDLLLNNPTICQMEEARAEILFHIHGALAMLSQALGIRVPASSSSHPDAASLESTEMVLDGGLVASLLQTVKGKKLVSRSLNLLPPEQRWLLLPVILARILQAQPATQTAEELAIEKTLMKAILEFVQKAQVFQKQQQQMHEAVMQQQRQYFGAVQPPAVDEDAASSTVAPFSLLLLSHLRQCVKSVMITYSEKKLLRQSLLSNRTRAEVMHVIVQAGDELAAACKGHQAEAWSSIKETFMAMLDDSSASSL